MIAAMILCTHLATAKVVTGCTAKTPSSADFTVPSTGAKGVVMVTSSDVVFDAVLAKAPADMTTASRKDIGVIVALRGAMPAQIEPWLMLMSSQCGAREMIAITESDIKREKSNPAGVVDLAYLHRLGETLQSSREQLKVDAAEYQRGMHVAFNAGVCR